MENNKTVTKRVLRTFVQNPKPDGRKEGLLHRQVIPAGTAIVVTEWDDDDDHIRKVLGVDPATITDGQRKALRHADIFVHPFSAPSNRDHHIYVDKSHPLYDALMDASDPVETSVADWAALEYCNGPKHIAKVLGKVLEVAVKVPSTLPALLGIDESLDTLVKSLLAGKGIPGAPTTYGK